MALSCGHTDPLWYESGLYEAIESASVRTPQPENISGDISFGDHLPGTSRVDDAGPEAMAHVRRQRVDGPLLAVEPQCVVATFGKPEVTLERRLQRSRLGLVALSRGWVTGLGREVRASDVGPVHIGLHLAQRDGGLGQAAVSG